MPLLQKIVSLHEIVFGFKGSYTTDALRCSGASWVCCGKNNTTSHTPLQCNTTRVWMNLRNRLKTACVWHNTKHAFVDSWMLNGC